MKRIAILGSTGSIGTSALSVADAHPDRIRVVALAAGRRVEDLAAQITRYRPAIVVEPSSAPVAESRSSAAPLAIAAMRGR